MKCTIEFDLNNEVDYDKFMHFQKAEDYFLAITDIYNHLRSKNKYEETYDVEGAYNDVCEIIFAKYNIEF